MDIMHMIEKFSHHRCKKAMEIIRKDLKRLRGDLITVNAEKAMMAQDLVTARRYADDLLKELESLKAGL